MGFMACLQSRFFLGYPQLCPPSFNERFYFKRIIAISVLCYGVEENSTKIRNGVDKCGTVEYDNECRQYDYKREEIV